MKIVAICPITDEDIYSSHAGATLKNNGVVVVNIKDSKDTVARKYQIGVQHILKNSMVEADDVVLFMHEDVLVLDSFLKEKLFLVFSENKTVGMVGVQGVEVLTDSYPMYSHGHVIQGNPMSSVGVGSHIRNRVGFFDEIVGVAPYFFAIRGSLLKDLTFNILDDRDVYSFDLGLQIQKLGYSLCVADILVFHRSSRLNNEEDKAMTQKKMSELVGYYTERGTIFPYRYIHKELENVVEIEL